MGNNYTYPAIINIAEDILNINFPDFDNATTFSLDLNTIVEDAQDFLALTIEDILSRNMPLPQPSNYNDITIDSRQQIIFINVWLPYHIAKTRETYTKKTLTIPTWLDLLAKEKNINFSRILTEALKKELLIM